MEISIIIVTYNSKKYIDPLMKSINNQKNVNNYEIICIDNNSTDGTYEYIKLNYPKVKIIRSNENLGYGKAVNLGVKIAKGKYIIIMNPDVVVSNNLVSKLISKIKNQEKTISTPKILNYNGTVISSIGLIIHFTGLTFTRGWNSPPTEFSEEKYINSINGCCFAIKKNDFIKLGGFDENFFIYKEDTELSWRANAYGYKIIYCPNAIVMHDYLLKLNPKKFYYIEFGRYLLLRKYYNLYDTLILLPSLIITEILIFGYILLNIFNNPIYIYYKFKALFDAIKIPLKKINLDKNAKKRLYESLDYNIPMEHLSYSKIDKLFRICINKLYYINYKIFKKLLT